MPVRRPPRQPLTPEQQRLAEKYVPMARKLCKYMKMSWPQQAEEFEGEAMLALVEAAQSYDPSRNVNFGTFARYRVWGALRDTLRRMAPSGFLKDQEGAPSFFSMTDEAERIGTVLFATDDPPVGHELEEAEALEILIRNLPGAIAEVCRLMYLDGMKQTTVAETRGVSKSRVSYLHQQALKTLRSEITAA
jgi:RNA polymerase sigma factor (sigma-70 family)